MPVLKLQTNSPSSDWESEFSDQEIIIGREGGEGVNLLIPDPSISRLHGKIRIAADGYWYEDQASTHGSKKNDSVILGPTRIFTGDVIEIGDSSITILSADATDEEDDLSELFDVLTSKDIFSLNQNEPPAHSPSTKVKIIGQKKFQIPLLEQESEKLGREDGKFIGKLVNHFCYSNLEDALYLSIEDIVGFIDNVERGAILLLDSDRNELAVKSHYPLFEPAVSSTLALQAMGKNKAIIWESDNNNEQLSASIKKLNIHSGMYAPMSFGDCTVGLISLDTTTRGNSFSETDLELFMSLSQILAALVIAKQQADTVPQPSAKPGR